MPPKGKQKKAQVQPPKPSTSSLNEEEDGEAAREKFAIELHWCVQQLRTAMETKKNNPKQAEEMAKSLKTLESQKATYVKKRMVMRSLFGDYRAKMTEEEKKFRLGPPKMKDKCMPSTKSSFLRKAVHSEQQFVFPSTDNTFKFNFNVNQSPEKIEGAVERINLGEPSDSGQNKSSTFKFSSSNNDFRFDFIPNQT